MTEQAPQAALDWDAAPLDTTLWGVYGPDCFPTVFACQINHHRTCGRTIWGFSVYKGEPGFRTLGVGWAWANEHSLKLFLTQAEAFRYIATLFPPPPGQADVREDDLRDAMDAAWKRWTGGRSALDGMGYIARAALDHLALAAPPEGEAERAISILRGHAHNCDMEGLPAVGVEFRNAADWLEALSRQAATTPVGEAEAIIVRVLDTFHDGQREKKAKAILAALSSTQERGGTDGPAR